MSSPCLLLLLLLALSQAPPSKCLTAIFASPAEKAVRTWSTQMIAEYSSSSECLVVAFPSAPLREEIGTYQITLRPASREARSIGPVNVSWEVAEHFKAAQLGNASFYTLLKVPFPTGFQNNQHAYKIHLLPLMYKNNTEILSLARTSKLAPQCHVTFSPSARPPPRLSTSSSADCSKRWRGRPPGLAEAISRLRLRVTEDGCCLARLGEVPTVTATESPEPSFAPPFTAGVGVSVGVGVGVAGSLLIGCCALVTVRATRILRRQRIALAPSGAPYSLLVAHCRSVHSKEPLLQQGMAFRIYLRPWGLRGLSKAVLGRLWPRRLL